MDSVIIKNNIVFEDPTEQNIRKYLNFGHTLGHAIESFYLTHPEKTTLLHGEAIAIGMIMEAYISAELLSLTKKDLDRISEVILATFSKIEINPEHYQPITDLMIHDKKNEKGTILFVLLNSIGDAKYNCIVPNELILKAFDYYKGL